MRTIIVPDDARIVRVSELRERRDAGLTLRQLSAEYGVSFTYLSRVLAGKRVQGTDGRRGKVELGARELR